MNAGIPYRQPKPGRTRRRVEKESTLTAEEIVVELTEELGDDTGRHQKMLTLLQRRRAGDQRQAAWIRERRAEQLVELYTQVQGVTGDDLLRLLTELDSTTSAAVLRRIEATFIKHSRQMSAEALLQFASRYRNLTENEAAALKRGKHRGLVQLIERHTEATRWAAAPTTKHLENVYRSPRSTQEVYWTLLEDHLKENPYIGLSFQNDGTIPFEQLLAVAQSIGE